VESVVILDLKGKITLGEGPELLKDAVIALVLEGKNRIILNLADVPYIDISGLQEIVRCYTTIARSGGTLKLLHITKSVTDLLSISKLLTVFKTFDNETDALASFNKQPASP
jgi:anti-sigma B factor antagonist